MPRAVKLSKKFYDRFGDDIVNELVDLVNQVDASYKNELRELNEMNFARFDAKLEQRMAELRAWMEGSLREQTRFFFLAWAILLASNFALWFRS